MPTPNTNITPAVERTGVVLDACVLYPTIMRELLLGVAALGAFEPYWSGKILQEWALAVKKNHPDQEDVARGEIAVIQARWPKAAVEPVARLKDTVFLPDPDDVHVLETAMTIKAPLIVTMNLKDFPRRILATHGIAAQHPDAFLVQQLHEHPDTVFDVARNVLLTAEHLSGHQWTFRKLMKKARMPRFGKQLETLDQT